MTNINSTRGFVITAYILVAFLFGCSKNPKCYPVIGKVTFDGTVIETGSVTFFPETGGRPAMAEIQPDGTYQLSSYKAGDGIPAGNYKVTIESVEYPPEETAPPKSMEEELAMEDAPIVKADRKPPKWFVPEEYSSTASSPLRATVEKEPNTIDFTLTSP